MKGKTKSKFLTKIETFPTFLVAMSSEHLNFPDKKHQYNFNYLKTLKPYWEFLITTPA